MPSEGSEGLWKQNVLYRISVSRALSQALLLHACVDVPGSRNSYSLIVRFSKSRLRLKLIRWLLRGSLGIELWA